MILRDNIDENSLAGFDSYRPLVFQDAVGSSVEIGVLCEVIEPLSRAIERGGDVMAAIVGSTSIGFTGIGLIRPRPRR